MLGGGLAVAGGGELSPWSSRAPVLVGGACLAAAGPAPLFPGAEFAVVAGLGAQYLTATRASRPLRSLYVLQLLHFLWFSASLGYVMSVGMMAIAAVGPLYTVGAVAALRPWIRGEGWRGAVAYAVAVAVAEWSRASMPQIAYPHGQPVHALALDWPMLIQPVAVCGQPGGNALLALLGAGVAQLVVGARMRGVGVWVAAAALIGYAASIALAVVVRPRTAPDSVPVAVVQPGIDTHDFFTKAREDRSRVLAESLFVPTRQLLADRRDRPLALVVWPENAWWEEFEVGGVREPAVWRPPVRLPDGVRLLTQTVWLEASDRPHHLSLAVLRDRGGLVGWHEKAVPVPVGERPPLVELLPAGFRQWLIDAVTAAMGFRGYAYLGFGRPRPPLELADGTPFGALVCFDNAFIRIARERVASGARFLCVLSNESWYRGGHELDQLLALTVCHAVETRTPHVRATLDGYSAAVDARGRIVAALPRREAGVLVCDLELGGGTLPPLAALPSWILGLLWVLFLAGFSAGVANRGILLRRTGTASSPHRQHPAGALDEP